MIKIKYIIIKWVIQIKLLEKTYLYERNFWKDKWKAMKQKEYKNSRAH